MSGQWTENIKNELLSGWGSQNNPTAPALEESPRELGLDANLLAKFQAACATPSDINEHCNRLMEIASGCDHVTEFSVRTGSSTTALMAGKPKMLVSYDVNPIPTHLKPMADSNGVDFHGIQANPLDLPPVMQTDLLFIDTFHTYKQLSAELKLHGNQSRRWIVMHDTIIYGFAGEDGQDGLLKAIGEFLNDNPEWAASEHHANNNGLTVLVRWNTSDESRGAGDTIAKFTEKTGIAKAAKGLASVIGLAGCGCTGRQNRFNKWFPNSVEVEEEKGETGEA